jgi:hypothetical protein
MGHHDRAIVRFRPDGDLDSGTLGALREPHFRRSGRDLSDELRGGASAAQDEERTTRNREATLIERLAE